MNRAKLTTVILVVACGLETALAQDLETFAVQVSRQELGDFWSQGGFRTAGFVDNVISIRTEEMAGRLCTTFNTRSPRNSRIAYFGSMRVE